MKNKIPLWTYVISFLNPIIPSFIMVFLGICLVLYTEIDSDTHEVISKITFMKLYYPAVLLGIYLCMAISLLHHYLIRKGILRPRWWQNLILIIFGYGVIPLLSVLLGPQVANINADSIVILNYLLVVPISIIGFIVITLNTANILDYKTKKAGVSGFLFPSNIGRAEFLARHLALGVIALSLGLLVTSNATQLEDVIFSPVFCVLSIAFALFGIWFAVIPRINDLGWSKKLAWLMIIPFVRLFMVLILLVKPKNIVEPAR